MGILRIEFASADMELGFEYADSPVVAPDGTPAPPRDPAALEYVPVARPGHRLPHADLDRAGAATTTHDLLEPGAFLLLAGGRGASWCAAAETLGIRAHAIGPEEDLRAADGAWYELRGHGDEGAVLVRPDGMWPSARRAPFPTRSPRSAAPTTSRSLAGEQRSLSIMSERAAPVDADAARLRELGYEQGLDRGLRILDNAALGFAGISPVVGLYAVVLVGTVVAGPAWVWVLPVALAGQCLLLVVYAELASEFPIAGGAYQWSRRLLGASYGWMAGWVAVCAYAAANTTIAYLGAPWALKLLGIEPTANAIVVTGIGLVVVCSVAGVLGIGVLSRMVKAGIAAEILATVGIGLALLLVFRRQDLSVLTDTFGAEALFGGSQVGAMLAALAVGGWVFIGFDVGVGASEETRGAARGVPKALWIALLGVAALVLLNAVAATLAHPDPRSVVEGGDADPITTASSPRSARGPRSPSPRSS